MFDWSKLNRQDIADAIQTLSPKLVGDSIQQQDFHRILSTYLKRKYRIKVSEGWDTKVKTHAVFTGGTYYSDLDAEDKKCIELNFIYNPVIFEFKITKRRFNQLCNLIADTLLHEIIHMRQYRRRSFKSLPNYNSTASKGKLREEQSYLGNSDEIDAYGFNIACELLHKHRGDQQAVIDHLNIDLKGSKKSGGCWKVYLKAFEHDHNHEIIKKLKKKVIRYIPRAVEGRPFKNTDWICY